MGARLPDLHADDPDLLEQPELVDLAEDGARLEQLGLGALGDDPPVLEHDDRVGERDRREPVGDHDRRAVAHRGGEAGADQRLRRRVDGGGGVVEDQDPRVDHERPRDREPLALAAGERDPALADHRVVAVGKLLDERVRLRRARRRLDELLVDVGHAERDVVAHARREEERILGDDADLAAERAPRHVAHVDAVDEHAPLARRRRTAARARRASSCPSPRRRSARWCCRPRSRGRCRTSTGRSGS